MRCTFLLVFLALASGWARGGSLIANGDFARDVAGWSQWFSPGQAEGEGTWRARGDGGMFHIEVRRRDTPSAVQIYQGPFPVEQGNWYAIEFEGRAEATSAIRLAFMRDNPPYTGLGLNTDPTLGPDWRRYAYLVQATATVEDARLDFFLPVGEFQLDNVAVYPLGDEPARATVQSVRLGRGVSGRPEHLIDGQETTRVWLGGYPPMPAFLTLDLGEEAAVALVRFESEDRGQHLALGRVDCEVSRDGFEWRQWGTFAKAVGTPQGDRRPTVLTAAGEAVPARYVRLRVVNVRNSAPFRQAAVFVAPNADPAALRDLPLAPPSSQLAFKGWDYGRLGYDLSVGQTCALRFANHWHEPVEAAFSWTLETYAGEPLLQGEETFAVAGDSHADVPLALPENLADGQYRVRFALADGGEAQAFHFDHRRAVAGEGLPVLTVAAYLDNQDPEGWVWLSAGPLANHLNVQRRLESDPPDALLLASEAWTVEDPRVGEVLAYVRQGGLALCYGKLAPVFDEMLPVRIDRGNPRLDELVTLDGATLGLAGEPIRQRALRAEAKPGTRVLANWSDGTPAVVEGSFGQGRVIFVGAGLGRAWTQTELGQVPADRLTFPLLYDRVHGTAAGLAARWLLADRDANWCAQRPDTLTFGRYGWDVREGGLVENFDEVGRLSSPVGRGTWGPSVPGREIVRGVPTSLNWLAKRTRWLDGDGNEVLATTISTAAPCLLWETAGTELEIAVPAEFLICEMAGRAVVRPAGVEIAGRELSAGWLVLPDSGPGERDAPRYVQFARRPLSLRLENRILRVRFPAAGGEFWTGRLFGIRRFAPGATAAWAEGSVPEEVTAQAKRLARLCLAFPVHAEETGEQVADESFWRVANTFSFREIRDEFGTDPLAMAPLPPVLALVHRRAPHLARVAGIAEDLGVATKYGPLMGIPGDRLVYEISQVADEHFGVVPGVDDDRVRKLADFHGRLALPVAEQASGGLTTHHSFLADLREYMSSGRFRPPFAAPCIDLYKWWYCFPAVAGRPVYSPEARREIDEHYRKVYRDTLDLYPHKAIVRHRREPWTGMDYTASFVWPVTWRDGVRFLVDQNESAAVIAYCLWTYAQYFGDWDTVRANWHLARWLWAYLPRVQDWALMCSSNQAYFSTAGIDMLNSEYPGNLAMARMAQMLGDRDTERLARHLAAKSSIPAIARFLLPAYTEAITAEGDPWRRARFHWSMSEGGFGGSETVVMRGGAWSILQLGIGMYDTSKGTGPEIAALYQAFVPEETEAYQQALLEAEREFNEEVGWAHIMSRAFLGWPKEKLVATAERNYERIGGIGWQSTKYPHNLGAMATAGNGFHLVEWRPAGYVAGVFDPEGKTVVLDFENTDGAPVQVVARSAFAVTDTRVEGGTLGEWADNAETGLWQARVTADGPFRVHLRLGDSRPIPNVYAPPKGLGYRE